MVENFVDVHALERNNMMHKANRNDNLKTLMSPMLLYSSRGFPEEAFHCTTEDARLRRQKSLAACLIKTDLPPQNMYHQPFC